MKRTTSSKRTPTKTIGVFYKEITNDNGTVIDKQYGIRWNDENGKSRLKNIGTYSSGIRENFCKKLRDEIVVKVNLGERAPKFSEKTMTTTINDMAYEYFEYKSATVKDIEKEIRRYENHAKPLIGHIRLDNLTEAKIIEVQDKMTKTLAVATVRSVLVALNAMYKRAVLTKVYSGDIPTANIKHPTLNNIRDRYLDSNEINKLLEVCHNAHYELWLFVKLSLSTGGRVGTILTIKGNDFKLVNNSVRLTNHKNSDTYTGFYNDELKEIIAKRISQLKSPNDKLIQLGKTSLSYRLGAIMDILFNQHLERDDRIGRAVPHTLRHTFASQLAINGVPIYTIQTLMNHKTIEMTMRYAKLAPDQGMDAVLNLYK